MRELPSVPFAPAPAPLFVLVQVAAALPEAIAARLVVAAADDETRAYARRTSTASSALRRSSAGRK